jgi:hypothetical protein
LRDQVLEVRNVDGRLHIARKPRLTATACAVLIFSIQFTTPKH